MLKIGYYGKRNKKKFAYKKICMYCGETFEPKRKKMKYCSEECRKKHEDSQAQKLQCKDCKWSCHLDGGYTAELICGYIFKNCESRNCDINPCTKFEER